MTATPINLIFGPVVTFVTGTYATLAYANLNDADNAVAWILNIPKSGSITKIGVYCASETGTSPAYNAGLVTLDSSGNPTTTAYSDGANGTITFTAEGMYWLTLPTPATATAGDFVAVHVWPTGTAPDGSNYAAIQYESIWRGNGLSGNFTTVWAFSSFGPGMAIQYSDGSIFGFAAGSRTHYVDVRSDSTPDEYGNKFTAPAAMTTSGARLCHAKTYIGSSFAGSVILYDNSNNAIASAAISDKDFIDTSDVITVHWTPVTLTADAVYRIVIKPSVSGSNGRIYLSRALLDSAAAKDSVPGALNHVATYRTDDGAWTDTTAEVAAIGLIVTAIDIPSGPGTTVEGRKIIGPQASWASGSVLSNANIMSSASKISAMRIVLPKSGMITKIGCYVTVSTGSPPNYKCGLVTLDGSGYPTSTPYSDGAIQEESLSGTGFKEITLSTPVSATAGDRVAVSFFSGTTPPDTSNYVSILVESLFAYGAGRNIYYSTSWTTDANEGPNMYVEYSDGEAFGMANVGNARAFSIRSDTSPDEVGNLFTLSTSVTAFGIVLPNYTTGIGSSFTGNIIIYGPSDVEVLNYKIPDRRHLTYSANPRVPFSVPVALAADTPYRVVIKPTIGTGGDVFPYKYRSISEGGKNAMEGAAGWIATTRTDGGEWTDDSSSVYGIALMVSEETIPDNSGEGGGTVVGGEYAYIG